MKRTLLLAVSIAFGLSAHSLLAATNLVQNGGFESGTNDWNLNNDDFSITAANGPSASGTAAALLGGAGTSDDGSIFQNFPTTPGINYVITYDYKTLDTGTATNRFSQVSVEVDGSNGNEVNNNNNITYTPTTSFQTAIDSFTANSGTSTIYVSGNDEVVVDNVSVVSGSFSKPGRFTGSVKITGTIPSQTIGAFHTESVVARISPSGGIYWIMEPTGDYGTAALLNDSTIAYSGSTQAVKIADKDHISFSYTAPNFGSLETTMDFFKLKRAGK